MYLVLGLQETKFTWTTRSRTTAFSFSRSDRQGNGYVENEATYSSLRVSFLITAHIIAMRGHVHAHHTPVYRSKTSTGIP